MTVFRYDKTFEGLLTAVFDAYARRQWPDVLLDESEIGPLFVTEEHVVVTDGEKSGRVWRGVEARVPKEVCNMLFYGWLSEEPGVDMMLVRYIRRIFGGVQSVGSGDRSSSAGRSDVYTDFRDPDILRIKQLAQKVSYEAEHIRQFTRFQKGADAPETPDDPALSDDSAPATGELPSYGAGATYFAPVSPRYNALPLAIPYFRDRFRDQKWLIYDIRRRYGYYYDMQTVTEITMEDDAHLLGGRLDEAMMAADEKLFQDLWRTYFKSMAIEARINPRLQRQHMPRRFWHLLTEMQ